MHKRLSKLILLSLLVSICVPSFSLKPTIAWADSVTVECSGTSGSPTAVTEADLAGDAVTFSDAGGDGYCVLDNPISAASVVVESGVTITHTAEDTDGVTITTTGNFTLGEGASLNADAKGYAGGLNEYNDGTGTGHGHKGPSENSSGSGAGYGGAGGTSGDALGGITYGDLDDPTDLGSGGGAGYDPEEDLHDTSGGAGGGLININADTLTINGSISADGEDGHTYGGWQGGGGSGGSIKIVADTLSGSSCTLSVKGGDASGWGGGGGGGRVFISGTDQSTFLSDITAANTATGGTAAILSPGANGTLSTDITPAAPSIILPPDGSYNQSLNPTLTSSAYVSYGTHVSSSWKITTDSAGTNVVWSKDADTTNKTSIVVNSTNGTFSGALSGETTLANNTPYYAFVRYTNADGDSAWSPVGHVFTTLFDVSSSTYTWDFSDAEDYTYDDSYVEVDSGLAGLDDLGGETYYSTLSSYSYRKPIYITNTGSELTDYQVNFTVSYDSNMQIDFDDIRFTTDDGATEIDYWIESKTNSVSANVWVEVPTLAASGDTTIYMYYGNSGVSSASSHVNTMTGDYSDDTNLLLQWLMNEGTGTTVTDSSGNDQDGTLTYDGTGGWFGADNYFSTGDSLNFDGEGTDRITSDVQIDTTLPNDFTLETWIYIDTSDSGWGGLFYNDSDDAFIVQKKAGNYQLDVYIEGMYTEGDAGIDGATVGEWNHIVVTHDKSEADAFKVYVNGTVVRTRNFQNLSPSSTGNFIMGGAPGAVFDGKMDEMRIYTRYMTQDEVTAHYEHHKYAATEPTVSWGDESSTVKEGWTQRKAYAVINNTAGELTNYQTQFSITYDSDMQIDFDDLIFTASDGTTLLDYWLETKVDSTSATVWVEIPSIPASSFATVYMYYGNSGASSSSNIANTFVFGDDFSTDTSANYTRGDEASSITVSGGAMNITNGGGNAIYAPTIQGTPPASYIAEARMTISDIGGLVGVLGFQSAVSSPSTGYVAQYGVVGVGVELFTAAHLSTSAITYSADTYYLIKGIFVNGTISSTFDRATTVTASHSDFTSGYYGLRTWSANSAVDWFFVRKYAATEPTIVEAGSEEAVSYSNIRIFPLTGVSYTNLGSFTETLGAGNEGSVKYQLSDNGDDWYYHDGDSWVEATENSGNYNTASEVNIHLTDFTTEVGTGTLLFKAFLISNRTQAVELDSISVNYDSVPDGPTSLSLSDVGVEVEGTATAVAGNMLGTHVSTSWKIQTGSNCAVDSGIAWSSLADTSHKTSISYSGLAHNTTYYLCVANYNEIGMGEWASSSFITSYDYSSSTHTWDFTTPTDYTYDDSYVDVDSGLAELDDLGDGIYPSIFVGWDYRKTINFYNPGSELTDYQIELTIPYDSNMQADFDDIRFTSNDGVTFIDYWLETKTDSVSATVWVEVPSIPASSSTNIYMYYGSADAVSASSGTNTFEFFDDFSGDLSKWVNVSGTWNTAGGILNSASGALNFLIADTAATFSNYVMDYSIYYATDYDGGMMNRSQSKNNADNVYVTIKRHVQNDHYLHRREGADWGSVYNSVSYTYPDNTWMYMSETFAGSTLSTKYYSDPTRNNLTSSNSWTDATWSSGYVGVYNYQTSNNVKWDDFRIRQYVASEPIVSWGDTSSTVLENWTKRKQYTVLNNTASEVTDYQTQFLINYDADMQADFDDLRFTAADGTTLLDYWLESKTDSTLATVWVEIPSIPASSTTTVYMYYGNAGASSASNKANTMTSDYSDDVNLLLQWLMDEGSGTTVTDSSGNDNDGALTLDGTGGWLGSDNYFSTGDSLNFDGTGTDRITSDVQIDTTLPNDFTLETWIYIDTSDSGWGGLFYNDSDDAFIVQKKAGNYQLDVYIEGMYTEGDFGIDGATVGEWNHIVVTHDKSEADAFKIYVNGTVVRTKNFQNLSPSSTGNFIMGGAPGAVFDGKMDEMKIYTRYMTQDEVTAHYEHRQYVSTEPTVTEVVPEEPISYANVSILPVTGFSFINLLTFMQTLGAGNEGNIGYQFSNDGATWYYYNGSSWIEAAEDYAESNTAAVVNTNIIDFPLDVGTGTLYFKAFLISDSTEKVELDSLTVTYNSFPKAPTSLSLSGTSVAISGTASATAGQMIGTHVSTSWKIQTGSDCSADTGVVWSSLTDTTNKTSISYSGLSYSTSYYLCVASHNEVGRGAWASSAFTTIPYPNDATTITSVTGTELTDGSGDVTISFIADDPDDDDTLQALVEYNVGAGWVKATISETLSDITATHGTPDVENDNAYQIGNAGGYITTSSGANTITAIWESATDAPTADLSTAQIRVTPYDGTDIGTAVSSSTFVLDNVTPSGLAELDLSSTDATEIEATWTPVSAESNFSQYELWVGTSSAGVLARDESATEYDSTDITNLATMTTSSATLSVDCADECTYYVSMWAQDDYGNEVGPISSSILVNFLEEEEEDEDEDEEEGYSTVVGGGTGLDYGIDFYGHGTETEEEEEVEDITEPVDTTEPTENVEISEGSSLDEILENLDTLLPEDFEWGEEALRDFGEIDLVQTIYRSSDSLQILISSFFFQPFENLSRIEVLQLSMLTFMEDTLVEEIQVADLSGILVFLDAMDAEDDVFYLTIGFNHGVISGYPDQTFRPMQAATRAEALKMLLLSSGAQIVVDPSQGLLPQFNLEQNPFSDMSLNEWYAPYALYAYNKGIIHGYGDGTFRGDQVISRVEFSKILTNLYQLILNTY